MRCPAVLRHGNLGQQGVCGIVQPQRRGVRGQAGHFDGKRGGTRQKTHLALTFRAVNDDGLFMGGVAMAPRGLHEVPRTICREPPERMVAIPVVGHGDVDAIDARGLHDGFQPKPLHGPRPAPGRLPVVRKVRLLNHFPPGTEQDGAEMCLDLTGVLVLFNDLHGKRSRCGVQIQAPRPAQAQGHRFGGGYRLNRPIRVLGGVAPVLHHEEHGQADYEKASHGQMSFR